MPLHPAIARMGGRIGYGTRLTEALTIERLNGIMDAIEALARPDGVTAGPGLKATSHSGTTVVGLARRPRGGGGTSVSLSYPFDLFSINASAGTCKVRPGTVNGIAPAAPITELSFTAGQTYYLVLKCTAAQGAVTSFQILLEQAPPAPVGVSEGYPPNEFRVMIGLLDNGTWYRTFGEGSVIARVVEVVKIPKDSPAAGEYPLRHIYTWEASC